MSEPCPNCRARIIPIKQGNVKICPICQFRWIESGSFTAKPRIPPYPSS